MNKKAFLTTLPDFVEIQRASFCWFLSKGLSEELEKFSSITDLYKFVELNFFGQQYKIKRPKFDILESKRRNITYAVKIYVPVSITLLNSLDSQNSKINVFLGDLPLMTDRGTFLINGFERVIINQIIRSPGIYYKEEFSKTGNSIYSATLIPNRGSWLKFEIHEPKTSLKTLSKINSSLSVSIDKTDKIDIIKFLAILGISIDQMIGNLTYPKFF